jgi:invasion protein IalB
MRTLNSWLLAVGVAAGLIFVASAQAAKPTQASSAQPTQQQKPAGPTVVKSFQGWEVRCYPAAAASPCDVREMLANKKTGQRLMSLSIAYVPSRDAHVMVIIVPLGVDLAKGVKIMSDSYNSDLLHYRRCDGGGCYVEMLVDNATVSSLGSATTAKLEIVPDGAKPIDLTFPMDGFSDAHSLMVDLAKQKGTPPPAAPQQAPATQN